MTNQLLSLIMIILSLKIMRISTLMMEYLLSMDYHNNIWASIEIMIKE